MALVNTGTDSWILEYNSCERLALEISEQVQALGKEKPGTPAYDSLSGRARVRLRQYTNEINELRSKLRSTAAFALTTDERERRTRQVEQLQSRLFQLERLFDVSKMKKSNNDQVAIKVGNSSWADDDDSDDELVGAKADQGNANASVDDLRTQQKLLLEEQDKGLEELSQVISRQKRIATVINEEVDDQNALLDDIANNMDRVDTRVVGETALIKTISRKDSTWVYWTIILLLFLGIVVVIAVPGR